MSKRYPGIRHIKDDVYEINYYPYPGAPRKQYRVKAGSTQEAFLVKARDAAQVKTGENVIISSFGELGTRLELKLRADNLSPKTIKNLKSQFKNFFERFLPIKHPHIVSINQLTRVNIENYKQWVVVDQGRATGWRDELARIIKQYALARRKTVWLFPNRNNNIQHKDKYTAYIKRISRKVLGITITPHDFRHSFCTTRLKEGSTPRDIMAITGHKDIDSFNIYTHPTSEGTKKVIENSKLL